MCTVADSVAFRILYMPVNFFSTDRFDEYDVDFLGLAFVIEKWGKNVPPHDCNIVLASVCDRRINNFMKRAALDISSLYIDSGPGELWNHVLVNLMLVSFESLGAIQLGLLGVASHGLTRNGLALNILKSNSWSTSKYVT